MEQNFAGRRVAVVGGTGGIGTAICLYLRDRGAEVYALGSNQLDSVPAGITGHKVDISDEATVEALVTALYSDDARPIDLVNSAGIVENDVAAEDMPMDTYDGVMGVNLRGVFVTCQAFGTELLNRGGGAIVNIASMSGNKIVNTPQRQSVYNASKAGVSALGRSLAAEWGPRGVRVNTVSPGYIATPLLMLKTHMHDAWKKDIVLDRFGTPDEVAAIVAFLLSEEAGYFCGSEILMDGGSALI